MIALDTSALIAILRHEPEAEDFLRLITGHGGLIGAPTALEFHMVLCSALPRGGAGIADEFLSSRAITIIDFDDEMLRFSRAAFDRYGKGRHPARLNFGDCLSYAVAKSRDIPLLFKGEDFLHTDVRPAYQHAS